MKMSMTWWKPSGSRGGGGGGGGGGVGTKLNPQRAVLRAETDRWDTAFEGAINDVARAPLGPRPPGELTVPERAPNPGCHISVKGHKL